ncbi:hypothetical protein GCM10007874_50170 [Labrys miyagiensis]|uniref:Uncharacterized protein n=1 Tax=Labrys miyagiensis TaxID=346912 RepID=A0ABQ6CSP5_9HYPH|nr:hypothetical protein GCM10007874_50170 [Labrys miyagiensis]
MPLEEITLETKQHPNLSAENVAQSIQASNDAWQVVEAAE